MSYDDPLYKEKYFERLPDHKYRKVMDGLEAHERAKNAEANKERATGFRLIFEKATTETLPFIVYCMWVLGDVLAILFVLPNYKETQFVFYTIAGLLALAMICPLLILPTSNLTKLVVWIKNKFGRTENGEEKRS